MRVSGRQIKKDFFSRTCLVDMFCRYQAQAQTSAIRIASPKSDLVVAQLTAVEDMLVEHLAETGEAEGPRIISSCHRPPTVSSRWARIFLSPSL